MILVGENFYTSSAKIAKTVLSFFPKNSYYITILFLSRISNVLKKFNKHKGTSFIPSNESQLCAQIALLVHCKVRKAHALNFCR